MRPCLAFILLFATVVCGGCDGSGSADRNPSTDAGARAAEEIRCGRELHDRGESRQAIIRFTQAIELAPEEPAAYLFRGDARTFIDDFDGAVADYTAGIRRNPSDPNAYLVRGEAYTHLNRHDDALADYERALSLDPKLARAHLNIGDVHFHVKKDRAAARKHWEKAAELDPKDPRPREALRLLE